MPTLAPTSVPAAPASRLPGCSIPAGKHELNLHLAQAEILDRELELRKTLLRETERILSEFERVLPVFEKRSPVFSAYAQQMGDVRRQIEEMKQRERMAELPTDLPLPDAGNPDYEFVVQNAKRAVANHAYFQLLPMFHVLLSNLQPLLLKLAQSDRLIAAPLIQAIEVMENSWRKVLPLGQHLAVRRVIFSDNAPHPNHVEQARTIWREVLAQNPAVPYLTTLGPHESRPGKTRVAFICIGGLGDALLQTPCVAEIKRRLDPCEIVFIHSRGVVHPLLARNRTVDATLYAEDRLILQLPEALKIAGIFDVIFESRFVIWGERCHGSRITAEREVAWIRETQKYVAPFAPYLERFPQYSNLFARLVRPKMLLDIHGMSTGLPVTVKSPLVLCPAEEDIDYPRQAGLTAGNYVTVHDGFDEGFGKAMGISRCTKQLPTEKWRQLINDVRRGGLKVVQVGGGNEPLLPGVSLDLRGKTSLSQLAFVLKGAVVHIDTEGGIVHMARAVHKRAIVFFGPTSVTFWGYPQNINLCSEEYADHWWINFDWMVRSPIRQSRSAMHAFDVGPIAGLVAREQMEDRAIRFRLVLLAGSGDSNGAHAGTGDDAMWKQALASALARPHDAGRQENVAIIGPNPGGFSFADDRSVHADWFDVTGSDIEAENRTAVKYRRVCGGSLYNLPANSGQYDLVLCQTALDSVRHKHSVLHELLRLLKPGGMLVGAGSGSVGSLQPNGAVAAPELRKLILDSADREGITAAVTSMFCVQGAGPTSPAKRFAFAVIRHSEPTTE